MASAYFDFTHLLTQAMERAGTVSDRAAIAKAMEGVSYTGPFGRSQPAAMAEPMTIEPSGSAAASAPTNAGETW